MHFIFWRTSIVLHCFIKDGLAGLVLWLSGIGCHQLFFTTRWMLYGWVADSWVRFAAFLYLPVICAIPWSFVRYRVSKERIKVTRDAVYSSFSLLIIGALFTAIGLAISVLRVFKISFTPFDLRVLGVSALFAGTILAGSARMRRRVAKLVNRRFYSNRYDYRFQFFSLHRILGRVEGYEETIEEIRNISEEHSMLNMRICFWPMSRMETLNCFHQRKEICLMLQ
jgi:hypothetical protein